ncbi:WD40/YVTN/BNR-like repeat-containing protein [Salinicoccus roseus]|uniref:BNR/Asp-box repeat protein n=1 Tax=Salinicoccus roseus TaxID=45670 RepID=A0A265E6Q0_9STAP|nr:hypothetical protein [Salinicoccus roseus]OZT77106.1 hypothetical protein CFN03_08500 [Salinicoccus roseus]
MSIFNYEKMPYTVIAFKGNKIYAMDDTRRHIVKSEDGGATWSDYIWTDPAGNIRIGHITDSGAFLVFSSSKRAYRTENDITFTQILSDKAVPFGFNGVDTNPNTGVICFGEYNNGEGTRSIQKSVDDGITWQTVVDLTGEIHHFHSLQYFEEINGWLATTGDAIIRWIYSDDDFQTYKEVLKENMQEIRALNPVPTTIDNKKVFVFSSDGGSIDASYTIDYELNPFTIDIETLTKIQDLVSTSYGSTMYDNYFISTNLVTDSHYGIVDKSHIIIEDLNSGEGSAIDYTFDLLSNTDAGVFDLSRKKDSNGNVYITAISIDDGTGVYMSSYKMSLIKNEPPEPPIELEDVFDGTAFIKVNGAIRECAVYIKKDKGIESSFLRIR